MEDEIRQIADEHIEKNKKPIKMSAIASTAGIDVTGGMIGYLAKVL